MECSWPPVNPTGRHTNSVSESNPSARIYPPSDYDTVSYQRGGRGGLSLCPRTSGHRVLSQLADEREGD